MKTAGVAMLGGKARGCCLVATVLVGLLGVAGGFETIPSHDWTVEIGESRWGLVGYDGFRFGGSWREQPTTVLFLSRWQCQWGLKIEVVAGVAAAVSGMLLSGGWVLWRRGRGRAL